MTWAEKDNLQSPRGSSRTKWRLAWSSAVPLVDHVVSGDTKCTVTKKPDRTLPKETARTESKYTSSKICSCSSAATLSRTASRNSTSCRTSAATNRKRRTCQRLRHCNSYPRLPRLGILSVSCNSTKKIVPTAASSAAHICMHRNLWDLRIQCKGAPVRSS